MEPNRRKNTVNQLLLDNYITKSTEDEALVKKKSKEKSKERIENKENKCYNHTSTVLTSVNNDSKKIKAVNKTKINESFNYGRVSNNPSKSI